MTKIVTVIFFGALGLVTLNGVRLTFFPAHACNLVRENQLVPVSQSVMDFHRDQALREAEQE